MTPDGLMCHPFTRAVFDAVRPVLIKVEPQRRKAKGRNAKHTCDEYEFYLMRVGNSLATLLSHCESLSHAILFMSNYRETAAMGRAGVTRTKHLRYNIESYIIRTQTLYDLVLSLIDAVFHLQNSDSQCRHATIVQNLKVRQTEIPNVLKPLRKKLSEFEQARHIVIHRGSYQDDELYRIELFSELEVGYRKSGHNLPLEVSFVPERRVEMTRELIRKRKTQYGRFNSRVLQLVSDVFVALHKRFDEEERLRVLTGRNT